MPSDHIENHGGMTLKLIRHSLVKDPEGIRVTCNCGAEYLIENRGDWIGDYTQAFKEKDMSLIKIYEYESRCPDCGRSNYHGYDYRILPNVIHYPMFEREDWEERFQMPDDGRRAY